MTELTQHSPWEEQLEATQLLMDFAVWLVVSHPSGYLRAPHLGQNDRQDTGAQQTMLHMQGVRWQRHMRARQTTHHLVPPRPVNVFLGVISAPAH
jgi:hypothetical protein